MKNISALILTYNEEDNIKDCLESVNWVDEIVVIDSYSDDKTLTVASNFTDRVYQRKFDDFASQRNYGLEMVQSEWVLVIDADERVTSELQSEIKKVIEEPLAEGYRIPRKNYFLGKWIKYCGWYPDYTLRLFKASEVKYEGKVHESIKVNGKIEQLENPFIHFTYRNLAHYLDKMNHYTSLAAEEKYRAGKKSSTLHIIIRPALEFVKKYIFKKGFLLGPQGLLIAIISSYYQFQRYAKLWEKQHPGSDLKE